MLTISGEVGESLLEVGYDILDILKADADSDKTLGNSGGGQLLGGVGGVGHGGGVLDESFGVAERDGDGAELQLVYSLCRGLLVGLQLDRYHAAELVHLLLGDLVTLKALQTGVVHFRNGGVRLEVSCKLHGILAVAIHADAQRLEAAGDEERVERAHNRTGHMYDADAADLIDEFRLADDKARDNVAVTVDVFGRAVNNNIRAEIEGALEIGRAERVVNDDFDILVESVGGVRNGLYVNDLHGGVAGSLKVDDLRLIGEGSLERVNVVHVDKRYLNTELGDLLGEEGKGAAVESLIRDDLITGDDAAIERGGDGTHAGGGGHCGFAVFEGGYLLLNGVGGGVCGTGVYVSGLSAGKSGAALLSF